MILLKLNKNILIVFLLLSVFALGTLNFVDTVEAVQWKKYDSGKFTDEYPAMGNEKIAYYQSYTKGTNNLYVNIYSYSKNTGKKNLDAKLIFSKKNRIMTIKTNDYSWNKRDTTQFKTHYSVKTIYKVMIKEYINFNSIHPSKSAFDSQTFILDNQTVESYAIKLNNSHIMTFFYMNGEEISSSSIEKNKNTITIKKWDEKREVTKKETFKSTKSVNSIYKEFIKSIQE